MLQEASKAIEALEAQISTMAVEREEERSSLEDKLKQLEEDLGDQTSSILFGTQLLMDHQKSSCKAMDHELPLSKKADPSIDTDFSGYKT